MTRPTHAEEIVARLQRAASAGVPLPIPGAWETRMEYPAAAPITSRDTTGAPCQPRQHGASLSTSGRLEYERAGGGAPSQRRGVRRKRILVRLWRYLFHPGHLFPGWRHVVVQQR
jgi:hypothetical protein